MPDPLNPAARNPAAGWPRKRLRDAVFGLEDGMVSTLGALLGIAEGTRSGALVVLSGIVIVAVESLSMAAGSFLSAKSHRQYLERLLREEEKAIESDPETERREIRQMYGARGYSRREIDLIEKRLLNDKGLLLEDMAHKELGIVPAALEEPAANAAVMGFSYIAGGLAPLAPYFFFTVETAMAMSAAAALTGIFALGAAKGKLVGRSWWRSGLEMLAVAGAAAALGYLIGRFARVL